MQLSSKGKMILDMMLVKYAHASDTNASIPEDEMRGELSKLVSYFARDEISAEEQNLILRKLIYSVGVFKPMDEAIVDKSTYANQTPDWFTRIKDEHNSWFNAYKARLCQKDWSPNVIRELDRSSDAIMNYLGNPKSKEFNVRGLIMGDIQSGKTANFIALCNKAADAGYRVIIVTAGIIEKLRRQTQGRLEKEFINLIAGKPVVTLTGTTYDFKKEQGKNPVHVFREDVPVLCVVKKNVRVLQYLYKWLQKGVAANSETGDVLLTWPLLFIDDEADNASINTRELSEEADPTRTNELIRRILKSFTKSSYVGITATPFANVFIDPDTESKVVADDLFPRSFVYRLTTPSNYFGAERLFALGSPYLKFIDDIEFWLPASHKKEDYPSDSMPLSLRTAIGYFLLVNGVMDVMGEIGDTIGHRSMMIHISRFIPIQNRLVDIVEAYVKRLTTRISNYCCSLDKAESIEELRFLHGIWDDFGLAAYCNSMSWSKFLSRYLHDAVKQIETVVVNSGRSATSLDYENSDKRVIVIGGNALSRGLTLEGLVVSYFRRNTMMSDTLLQMGRWCGYRDSYQPLVRVWMPEHALDDFGYASDISEDISNMFHQIVEQKGTPKEFAFRIRKSPGAMLPTARNKMRSATRVNFPIVLAGHAIETPRMRNDASIITENNEVVVDFMRENRSLLESGGDWPNMRFFRGVKATSISQMLSRFKAGMMSYGFMIPQIEDYISKMRTDWDVAVACADGSDAFDADGRLPFHVKKSARKLAVTRSGREIVVSGTKLKVTSGGVMGYILTSDERQSAVARFRSISGNEQREPSDSFYLQEAKSLGKRPLLVLQYVTMSSLCEESVGELAAKEFFAFSFGFPGSKDDQQEEEFYFTRRAYEEVSLQEYFNSETEA